MRLVVIRLALRNTVACWLAAATETFRRRASSVVLHPSAATFSAAARVRPSSAPSDWSAASPAPHSAA